MLVYEGDKSSPSLSYLKRTPNVLVAHEATIWKTHFLKTILRLFLFVFFWQTSKVINFRMYILILSFFVPSSSSLKLLSVSKLTMSYFLYNFHFSYSWIMEILRTTCLLLLLCIKQATRTEERKLTNLKMMSPTTASNQRKFFSTKFSLGWWSSSFEDCWY